jgi:hypothetical protein
MQVIVMENLLKDKLAGTLLPIAGIAQRTAIIPTASRRLILLVILPGRSFAEDIPITMSVVEQG